MTSNDRFYPEMVGLDAWITREPESEPEPRYLCDWCNRWVDADEAEEHRDHGRPLVVGIVGTRHRVARVTARRLIGQLLDRFADEFRPFEIVSGGQRGVDTMARVVAEERGIPFTEYPESAETGTYGQRCRKRNEKVALRSECLIALPCKHSKGTYMTERMFNAKGPERPAALMVIECLEGEP